MHFSGLEAEFVLLGGLQHRHLSAWRFWWALNGKANPPHSAAQTHLSLRATPPICAWPCLSAFSQSQHQRQTSALHTQVSRQGAVAIDVNVGAPHMLFDGAAVVRGEGAHVQRQIAAGQQTEVDGACPDQGASSER